MKHAVLSFSSLSLCLAVVLAGCGGGGGGSAPAPAPVSPAGPQQLACADFATVDVPGIGRLTNNTWNKTAAGSFAASQCIQSRPGSTATQYGWSWSWPADGNAVYAFPEVILGWKPWDGGVSNVSQLPVRIGALQRFNWSYDMTVATAGKHNLATTLWITRTGATPAAPNPQDIANELMIWTAGNGFTPGGQLVTTASIGGRTFEVWYAQDWGDLSGANPNRWSYVAYRATLGTHAASIDVKALLDDAVARGYVNAQHHVSNVELGNQVMSGSGETWINALSLAIE